LSSRDLVADVRLEKDAAMLDGRRVPFRASRRDGEVVAIEIGGKIFAVRAVSEARRVLVWCAGQVFEFRTALSAARAREAAGDLLAPMPGRVRRIAVSAGSAVTRGEVVMVLEAMKMEHAIRAPRDGVVSRIAYAEGDLVEAGTPLVEIT
jgi:acetyl/propionyl-CoA carboxylase alpha subunit